MALVGDLFKTTRSLCIEWRLKNNLLSDGRYLKSQSFLFNKNYYYLTIPAYPNERHLEIVLESDNLRYNEFEDDDYGFCINPTFKKDAENNLVSCYVSFAENPLASVTITEDKSIFPHQSSIFIGSFDIQALSSDTHKISADSTLKILLTIKVEDKDNIVNKYFQPKRESTLVQNLEDLFLSEQEADILIKVKGINFHSHRSILAARSEVFAAMLRNEMAEKQTGEVVINDCDPDCFKNFLLYLYTGKTDMITSDNAIGLYYIAHKYAIEELQRCCTHCMMNNFSIKFICDVILFASNYNESDLLREAKIYFCEHADQIVLTTEWANFQMANLALSNDLLAKSFINLKCNPNPLPSCIGSSSSSGENIRSHSWSQDVYQLGFSYPEISPGLEQSPSQRCRETYMGVQPRSQRQ